MRSQHHVKNNTKKIFTVKILTIHKATIGKNKTKYKMFK